MLRHSDLVTSAPSPFLSPHFVGHGRVPIAVGAIRAGGDGGQEKIQPVKARHVENGAFEMEKKKSAPRLNIIILFETTD